MLLIAVQWSWVEGHSSLCSSEGLEELVAFVGLWGAFFPSKQSESI